MASLDHIHEPIRKLAVPVDQLNPYPGNARRGDMGALINSLETHGQYKPITVRAKTNEVLAGNHTLHAARELGWGDVAATFVDVDDDTAARIVLVDNRTSDLADYDNEALTDLLNEVAGNEMGLEGTGYTDEDLEMLQEDFDAGMEGVEGAAEPDKGDGLALWGVTVGEPDITPEPGSIWEVGHHTLVVVNVHKDWNVWTTYLTEGSLFWPYPSLMGPFTQRAIDTPVVFVQPNVYLAGWLLTKWNRLRPNEQAQEVTQ